MAPSDQPETGRFEPYLSIGGHGDDRQLDMFGGPPAQNYDPDPEEVRAELLDILARARAAPQEPWTPKELSYWRTVFPQMANWLPAEEAERLRSEFRAELARLEVD
jgi:hypothetical protein